MDAHMICDAGFFSAQGKNVIEKAGRKVTHLMTRAGRVADGIMIGISHRWQYRRMRVPAWNSHYWANLRRGESGLSRYLDMNTSAEVDAGGILAGTLRLFSATTKGNPETLDWHQDHFSGKVFVKRPYPLMGYREDSGSDIIVPWELSRLQWIPTLVQSSRARSDNKSRQAVLHWIDSWHRANPYLTGVNWLCGMDVAIRAVNLAVGLVYLEGPPDPELKRLLWAHVLYVLRRDLPKRRKVYNNHYIVSLVAVFILLGLFDGNSLESRRKWLCSAIEREVLRQFRPDGGSFEGSSAYHQFSLEAMLLLYSFTGHQLDPSADGVFARVAQHRLWSALELVGAWNDVLGGSPNSETVQTAVS